MLTDKDKQILMAARLLPKAGRIFVGVGEPLLASLVAKRQFGNGLSLSVEAAAIGIDPTEKFSTIGDGALVRSAKHQLSMADFFNYWIKKVRYDCVVLKAVEIDESGDLNTFRALRDERPTTLGGIGGAIAGAINAFEIVVLASGKGCNLVHELSHLTNPVGRIATASSKAIHVVTESAVFTRRDAQSGFRCVALGRPGLSDEQIFQGWPRNPVADVPVSEFSAEEIESLEAVRSLFPLH